MCKKNKKVKVGRFELEEHSYGVRVYDNEQCVGRIDGVSAYELSEEEIEELMFGVIDEEDVIGNYGEVMSARHDLLVEYGSIF